MKLRSIFRTFKLVVPVEFDMSKKCTFRFKPFSVQSTEIKDYKYDVFLCQQSAIVNLLLWEILFPRSSENWQRYGWIRLKQTKESVSERKLSWDPFPGFFLPSLTSVYFYKTYAV